MHAVRAAKQEAQQAKLASLVVQLGAVLFIVGVDPQFSIDLQQPTIT